MLTMDRYSHVELLDMTTALESLRAATSPESQSLQATGTTNEDTTDFSCTKIRIRPTAINRFQPISIGPMATDTTSGQKQKIPRFPAGNEGFEPMKVVGLEPTTYGLKVRCSTN